MGLCVRLTRTVHVSGCSGWNCAPLKRCVEVLTLVTADCALIWKWDFCRCGEDAIIQNLGGSLIRYDWCPYKKKRGDTTHKDDGGRDESDVSTGRGGPRRSGNTQS